MSPRYIVTGVSVLVPGETPQGVGREEVQWGVRGRKEIFGDSD